ncbi:MAG TPA: hypothetical protein VIJ15_14730, partial [Dermatophilaceae bacterium]
MAARYINEVRYSHLEDLRCVSATLQYDVAAPGTSFEQQLQSALAAARTYHLQDELALALDGYRELQALILKTVNPQLPPGVSRHPAWQTFVSDGLTDALMSTTAAALGRTPMTLPDLPPTVINPDPVPDDVMAMLRPYTTMGTDSGPSAYIGQHVRLAAAEVAKEDWSAAAEHYKQAFERVGGDQPELRGYLTHDFGLLTLRLGNLDGAAGLLREAAGIFSQAKVPEGEVASLSALADAFERQGQAEEATKIFSEATGIAQRTGLGVLTVAATRSVPDSGSALLTGQSSVSRLMPDLGAVARGASGGRGANGGRGASGGRGANGRRGANGGYQVRDLGGAAGRFGDGQAHPALTLGASELLTLQYLDRSVTASTLTLLSKDAQLLTVSLEGDRTANLAGLYAQLRSTSDLSLVQVQRYPVTVFAAYIPYVYFFVLPMSIGDCLSSMGDYAGAEAEYLAALSYRYLNQELEATKVWTRLSETYLAEADAAYRAAGEDAEAIAAVAPLYGRVVASDGTVPASSPLYASAPFAPFTARARRILNAPDPLTLAENPLVIRLVVQARLRQQQIAAGLNFFGFPIDYVPPFSFMYLQNAARYFAQHAATLEQSYIQFKSRAENEDFRRQQLEQQVELGRASVQLEQ